GGRARRARGRLRERKAEAVEARAQHHARVDRAPPEKALRGEGRADAEHGRADHLHARVRRLQEVAADGALAAPAPRLSNLYGRRRVLSRFRTKPAARTIRTIAIRKAVITSRPRRRTWDSGIAA